MGNTAKEIAKITALCVSSSLRSFNFAEFDIKGMEISDIIIPIKQSTVSVERRSLTARFKNVSPPKLKIPFDTPPFPDKMVQGSVDAFQVSV